MGEPAPHRHHDASALGHEAVAGGEDARRLSAVLALLLVFMAGEVAAGIAASSLALLSDAAHMVVDAGAIALSLVALRLAARPAGGRFTYGLKRTEILSAQVNGATLLVLGLLIVYEAVHRLVSPPEVTGGVVLGVALAGIVVNLLATSILARADRSRMSVHGSFVHLLTDLAAFVLTAIAGAVILTTGFERADGIASLVVAAIMLHASVGLLRDSGQVLLEGSPLDLDPEEVGRAMASQRHVVEVHDLHVWEVTSGFPALSAHVLVHEDCDCHRHTREMEQMLSERFGIEHTTLQVEHAHEHDALLSIESPASARGAKGD